MTGVNLRNNLRQSDTVREEAAVIDWSLGKAAQTESGTVVTGVGGRKNADSLCGGQSFSLEKTSKFWNRW